MAQYEEALGVLVNIELGKKVSHAVTLFKCVACQFLHGKLHYKHACNALSIPLIFFLCNAIPVDAVLLLTIEQWVIL